MVPSQPTSQCTGCGNAITSGTRFCPDCGKPVQPDNAPRPVAPPPKEQHQKKKRKTPAERMRSLVPVITAGVIGFAVGILNGTAGLIVSIAVGIALSVFFVKRMSFDAAIDSLKKNITKVPFILKIMYMVGAIMLISIFSVTASKSGLFLPTGHNPSTFAKYLSVIAVLPENLQKTTLLSAFPGHPVFTVPALVIVAVGAILPSRFLAKKWKPIIVLVGMIFLTAAPYLTHAWLNMKNTVLLEYKPDFYIVWVGFVLVAIDAYLPIILTKMRPSVGVKGPLVMNMMFSFIAPLFAFTYLLPPILLQIGGGFEAEHHFYATVISGGISGLAGASVVDDSTSTSEEAPVESSDDGGTSFGTASSGTPVSSFGGDAPSAGTKIPFITGGTAPWELTPSKGTVAGFAVPTDAPPVKMAPPATKTDVGGPNTSCGTSTGTSTGVAPTVTSVGPSTGTGQGHETATEIQPPSVPPPPVPILPPPYWQLSPPLQMTPPTKAPPDQPVDDVPTEDNWIDPNEIALWVADKVTSFAPGVHEIKDLQETGTGIDVFAKQELTSIGWLFSVLGVLTPVAPGGGSKYRELVGPVVQEVGEQVKPDYFHLTEEEIKKMDPISKMLWRSPPQTIKSAYDSMWKAPTTHVDPKGSRGGRYCGP